MAKALKYNEEMIRDTFQQYLIIFPNDIIN